MTLKKLFVSSKDTPCGLLKPKGVGTGKSTGVVGVAATVYFTALLFSSSAITRVVLSVAIPAG